MASRLVTDMLDAIAKMDGGIHRGFRPVHAKDSCIPGRSNPLPSSWHPKSLQDSRIDIYHQMFNTS